MRVLARMYPAAGERANRYTDCIESRELRTIDRLVQEEGGLKGIHWVEEGVDSMEILKFDG